jgi:hypothetical protein
MLFPTSSDWRMHELAVSVKYLAPVDKQKTVPHLIATDHLESPTLRGLTIDHLFDIVVRHGLHFDPARRQGVVFHVISCLTELGRVGLTAVGARPPQPRPRIRKLNVSCSKRPVNLWLSVYCSRSPTVSFGRTGGQSQTVFPADSW